MANQKYTKQIGDDVLYEIEAQPSPQTLIQYLNTLSSLSNPTLVQIPPSFNIDMYNAQLQAAMNNKSMMGLGNMLAMEPPKPISPNTKSIILVLEVQVPKDVPAHIVAAMYTPSKDYATECSYKDIRYNPSIKMLSAEEQDLSSVDDTKGDDQPS